MSSNRISDREDGAKEIVESQSFGHNQVMAGEMSLAS